VALWSGAAIDASRARAKQHDMLTLRHQLQTARQRAQQLPALRSEVQALHASADPEATPDSRALLSMIATAVEHSGVTLDLFDPQPLALGAAADGQPALERRPLHLRVTGAYTQVSALARALASQTLALIPTDASLRREANGRVELDATFTVIGAAPAHSDTAGVAAGLQVSLPVRPGPTQPLAQTPDPFGAALAPAPTPASAALGLLPALSSAKPVGHFRMGVRHATLLHDTQGWYLLSGPASSNSRVSP